LNAVGIQPDFILCRADRPIDKPRKAKIAMFCNVTNDAIISAPDVDNIYEIPINFEKDKLSEKILKRFNLKPKHKDLIDWRKLVATAKRAKKEIKVGVIGKYFASGDFILSDAYISVIESIKHAAWNQNHQPQISWINSDEYEKNKNKLKELKDFDCLIVPGGFGSRGIEGKISAIKYARENKIPYLGLCYGMQLASIEFFRNVCGKTDAHTEEINPNTKNPVIHIMPDQAEKLAKNQYGNTMRLGAYPCVLVKGSRVADLYGKNRISERHRHRYEFNNKYRDLAEKKGLMIVGTSPDKKLVEIIELSKELHPFFVGVQFHPELKSRPLKPHPLFMGLIKAGIGRKKVKK
ncbi:MAG TPA: CTP synthase, partial [Patescibacteria group bacterium]|nr:CTP synthase [Patescibacteria group bacterium]